MVIFQAIKPSEFVVTAAPAICWYLSWSVSKADELGLLNASSRVVFAGRFAVVVRRLPFDRGQTFFGSFDVTSR